MSRHIELGIFGENVAADFLEKNGYRIVGRRIHESHNELDIIAEDENFLVFVEVKTRSCLYPDSGNFGSPGSAVDYKKRLGTVKAAKEYLRKNHTEKQPRIDVIEVFLKERTGNNSIYPQILNINHIIDAFDAKGRKH